MTAQKAPTSPEFPAVCWDPWLLKDDDYYRLFYLSGNPDQDPWWKTGWIGGAISSDLKHWHNQGPVLEPLPEQPWESGRIFAGNCYKEDGQYYLFYSAANAQEFDQETLGLAISSDGETWQRQPAPLLKLPAEDPIYGRCHSTGHLHWRDPAIYKDDASGKYYLYFCAFLAGMGSEEANFLGGLGLAIADQLPGPYQLLPPAIGPTRETAITWPFYHLERPQILYIENQFHLFFSCFKDYMNPQWLSKIGADSVTDSTLYWYVADQIIGPFKPISPVPIVPGSNDTGLYGTQFFSLQETEDEDELLVLGWFHETYQPAISQEFKALYHPGQFTKTLRIVANS
jgi:beta-fructofuranosidase